MALRLGATVQVKKKIYSLADGPQIRSPRSGNKENISFLADGPQIGSHRSGKNKKKKDSYRRWREDYPSNHSGKKRYLNCIGRRFWRLEATVQEKERFPLGNGPYNRSKKMHITLTGDPGD